MKALDQIRQNVYFERMKSSVTATEAKQRFGQIVGKVAHGKEHIQVEKQGKPLAVMIPMDAYEEYLFLKLQRDKAKPRDLLKATEAFRKRQPKPPAGSPDSVQMIRELRHRD